MSDTSLEARLQSLEDYREICNLQGRYNHYLQTGQLKDKMAELFAFSNPGVKVEMCDSGLWEGPAKVGELFKHMAGSKYGMAGSLMVHMLLTPVIEVAKDGRTAKGMWNSFGTNTYKAFDGSLEAMWQLGKYDLTFIKEDGKWKYLEFKWYVIFRTPFHEGWVKRPMVESLRAVAGVECPGFPPIGEFHTPYHPNKEHNVFLPCPPEPGA